MIKKSVQPKHIPPPLKEWNHWVGWFAEQKDNERLNKIPKNAKTGLAAKSNDSLTWSTFEEAVAYIQARSQNHGIGFVFSQNDPFLGIDLDDCRKAETGEIAEWAQELIGICDSYTEISPSGTGVKIFLQGQKPGPECKQRYQTGEVEMYDQKRFFTVTGHHLSDTPLQIKANQQAIDHIYHTVFSKENRSMPVAVQPAIPTLLDDQALIEKAMSAKNGAKLRALWQGDWKSAGYPSASEADLALASVLAFYTQRDHQQIERLMRQSSLNREKFQREDYLLRTIKKACQSDQVYNPNYYHSQPSEQPVTSVMGFVQGETHYYRQLNQGDDTINKQLSSFVIQPKQRILLEGKENLSADLITQDGSVHPTVFPRSAWNSKEGFMHQLSSLDLHWYGTAHDVQCLQAIVSSHPVPMKEGTTKLGHQGDYWIWPDSVVDTQGIVEDPPLVYLPLGGKGELDDKLKPTHLPPTEYKTLLEQIYTHLFSLNRPEVVIPTIGWFMATPFKKLLSRRFEGFPHLSVAGTRGAGKSTFLRLMWRLMGFQVGNASRLFSCTETNFVMLKLLSSTSTIPIILDEFKPYDMPVQRLKALTRTLRKAYDGEKEFRGRPDQTTNEYALTAPVAIAGEVSLSEGALLERIIAIEMSPNHLNQQMRKSFHSMQALPLQAFISGYIPFVLSTPMEKQLQETELVAVDLLNLGPMPDRVRNNLMIMIFGFNQFIRFGIEQGVLSAEDDYLPFLKTAVQTVKEAVCSNQGVTRLALDYLLEHLAVMAETGKLREGMHYKFDQHQVFIRLPACLAEFRRYHRETQLEGELLDANAYRKQIRENMERKSYISNSSEPVR
ncbi:MAG: hypothetical protein QGI86_27570, partial [Candidatus Poribacteria bacterium]|nr:hypothetical protein [Candidatus Poribacteria bacterium]